MNSKFKHHQTFEREDSACIILSIHVEFEEKHCGKYPTRNANEGMESVSKSNVSSSSPLLHKHSFSAIQGNIPRNGIVKHCLWKVSPLRIVNLLHARNHHQVHVFMFEMNWKQNVALHGKSENNFFN